jgi:tellurite resistance protein TehA-like permease
MQLGNLTSTKIIPNGYKSNESAGFFLELLGDVMGLCMWGLCLWFFLVSVGAHWPTKHWKHLDHHPSFDMTWYSFVFPNTALITATHAVGKSFEVRAIQILGTVMSVLIILVWGFVFAMMLRAFWLRKLLWPVQSRNQPRNGPDSRGEVPVSQSRAVRYREQAQV